MDKFTLVVIFDKSKENLLFCKRTKEPFKGKLNFIGGSVRYCESDIHCAHREMREETGIDTRHLDIKKFMEITYYEQSTSGVHLSIFGCILNDVAKNTKLVEEKNPLIWVPIHYTNFFDTYKFAGDGNIGNIVTEAIRIYSKPIYDKLEIINKEFHEMCQKIMLSNMKRCYNGSVELKEGRCLDENVVDNNPDIKFKRLSEYDTKGVSEFLRDMEAKYPEKIKMWRDNIPVEPGVTYCRNMELEGILCCDCLDMHLCMDKRYQNTVRKNNMAIESKSLPDFEIKEEI